MSTTNDFWERFNSAEEITEKFPMNGDPSSNVREKDIITTIAVPSELIEVAEKRFVNYFLPEELVVENRTYRDSEGEEAFIVVELLNDSQTFDTLTAFLNENGDIQRYKFKGDTPTYLYDFINYTEGNQTISDEIWAKQSASDNARDERHPSMFQQKFYGKQLVYDVAYDFRKTGTDRFIVEITFEE